MVGLSLNLLCQHYCDTDLMRLLRSGAVLRCLFLDPDRDHIREPAGPPRQGSSIRLPRYSKPCGRVRRR
ncbi:DUF5919 domain-containing protein [Nocardia wallacei]|uniref:DUF5919 domain-containing protein n=1 Tax=Nocardia wallacei TaxID=480035 RepID=UPI003CC801FC